MDIWQTKPEADNSLVDVGGSRGVLAVPSASDKNTRTVYIESSANGAPTMVQVGVRNGQLFGFNLLDSRYSALDMAYIVNFLGFSVPIEADTYTGLSGSAAITKIQSLLGSAEYVGKPNLGGIVHSAPVLATYGGRFDSKTGNVSSNEDQRDDHILYGSMDGALHLLEAKAGNEVFAFIPRAMFEDEVQRSALKPGTTYDKIGNPKFGVDAPWGVRADYTYTDTGMTAKTMYAYGGLRMGGVGFYGLNILDKTNPQLVFSINQRSEGFERLGQTWAKPLVAQIKTGSGRTDFKDVLIFGGGYDMCYENPQFALNDNTNLDSACKNKTYADGSAVYMVDAKTGQLLQKWDSTSGNDGRQYINHSIVSEIVGRDRNNDGYVDHLYFADLGGQIFRIDLKSGVVPSLTSSITNRVVRLFDANQGNDIADNHINYRFYEKPAVSIHQDNDNRFALINISTGDRSSPVHKRRELADANRIYGIIDRDVATYKAAPASQTEMSALTTNNLTNNDLHAYDTVQIEGSASKRVELIADLKNQNKHGWYYKMTRFEVEENVKDLKAIGSSITEGNIYYTSIYNPAYQYEVGGSCVAGVLGGTERQLFCLPWGICANPETGTLLEGSKNGTLGYIKAGKGIQELAFTTLTAEEGKSTRFTALVGQQTFKEQVEAKQKQGGNNPTGASSDGTQGNQARGVGGNIINGGIGNENLNTMKVQRWYDLANAES